MSTLSFIEKQTICRLFGITEGFIFKFWSDKGNHNKSITKELILEACGINIFEDKGYKNLSQQKCVQKIWDECSHFSPQKYDFYPKFLATYVQQLCDRISN